MQEPNYLGVADLATRWQYTPQGVNKLARSKDFPRPAFTLNAGRVRGWVLPDIEAFESQHPEVTSPAEKRRKVVGFYIAVSKGQQPPEANKP